MKTAFCYLLAIGFGWFFVQEAWETALFSLGKQPAEATITDVQSRRKLTNNLSGRKQYIDVYYQFTDHNGQLRDGHIEYFTGRYSRYFRDNFEPPNVGDRMIVEYATINSDYNHLKNYRVEFEHIMVLVVTGLGMAAFFFGARRG